ncbi:MAG TPA: SRPBCC domain-containing protein [Polyangia bacterium]|nr:SRPBCC domain-containing protein [Polyangia bacterium]
MENLTAEAWTVIEASAAEVWRALVTPEIIKRYMFGATVVADWRVGGSIVWRGDWKGKPYEDKGEIVRFDPERQLRYTHWSPLSGTPDTPENRHTVTVDLEAEGARTRVSLSQDGNRTAEERAHSETNWKKMLEELKRTVESS